MAEVTPQTLVPAGVVPTFSTPTAADSFRDDGLERTFIKVRNTSGANRAVTILAQQTSANVSGVGAVPVADIVGSLLTGTERFFGPFPRSHIDKDGFVQMTLNSATGVTVATIVMPRVST